MKIIQVLFFASLTSVTICQTNPQAERNEIIPWSTADATWSHKIFLWNMTQYWLL